MSLRTMGLIASLLSTNQHSAELNLPKDGWVTWQVAAVADAPNWCCFGDEREPRKACNLEGRSNGYGSRSDDGPVDSTHIYARFSAGQLQSLRAYGPNCAVSAPSGIADLGSIDAESSARWLATQLTPRSARTDDVLAALATHAGAVADAELLRVASNDPARESRKDALFWMGQLRGETGAAAIAPFLTGDADAKVREHAGFAISQSRSARRAELLIQQAQQDSSSQVRSQAWFWLAQTGDPLAENAIGAAVQNDPEEKVRNQAVFALSQLPEQRGSSALIAVLENPKIALDERKQALFWLGQSEDQAAHDYIARVLSVGR